MGVQERRAREKEDLRQEILDAARELFAKDGYEAVSMRKIAERIEYSQTTIYLHFENKSELLDCLCEETFSKLSRKLSILMTDGGDPLDLLRLGMRAYIDFGLKYPNHYVVAFLLGKEHYPAGPDSRKARTGRQAFDHMCQVVRLGLEAGVLEPDDAAETSQALWAGVHGLVSLFIMKPEFPFADRDRLIDRMLNILIDGVRRK